MLAKYLSNVRKNQPLIHNITNYVTVNDVANSLLASGAAPIMSDDLAEVAEITTICGGLNLNIGTLNSRTIPAMFAAGKKANALQHPVLLDPVGVGASSLRTQTAQQLLDEVDFAVIRGNISEIKLLAKGTGRVRGVDAAKSDAITANNVEAVVTFAKEFSQKTGAIIVITGPTDIVAFKEQAAVITNGNKTMATITGSGCMLSGLLTAFVTANPDEQFMASVAGVCFMGLAGEKAEGKRIRKEAGNASFRNYLIDALGQITAGELDEGAKYVIR
jgi:hydroxyethylthiazole kinase